MTVPGVTSAPAPTRLRAPTTAPSSTMAPMPMRQPSSTLHPWRTTLWPTVTSSPRIAGRRSLTTCTVALSCRLLRAPMRTWWTSPRTTVWNQRLDCGPTMTSPTTTAASGTNAVGSMRGRWPSKATIMGGDATPLDGRRRVLYASDRSTDRGERRDQRRPSRRPRRHAHLRARGPVAALHRPGVAPRGAHGADGDAARHAREGEVARHPAHGRRPADGRAQRVEGGERGAVHARRAPGLESSVAERGDGRRGARSGRPVPDPRALRARARHAGHGRPRRPGAGVRRCHRPRLQRLAARLLRRVPRPFLRRGDGRTARRRGGGRGGASLPRHRLPGDLPVARHRQPPSLASPRLRPAVGGVRTPRAGGRLPRRWPEPPAAGFLARDLRPPDDV